MVYRLIIKEEAKQDINNAYLWYEEKLEGLGERFVNELDSYFKHIEKAPKSYQVRYLNYRAAALKIFPYLIVYQIEENSVIVFAVFATKQNPKKMPV
jgi:plasmid stabilization system protein ParE